jgi:hypothetical protein
MREAVRGGTAWLAATALVAGLAAVTTAPVSGAAAPAAKPGKCTEIIQVWAGGLPSFAMADAADQLPGAPVTRTVRVSTPKQGGLTPAQFRRLDERGLEDPYFRGYRGRADDVVRTLRSLARTCPGSLLAVGGHSAGAVVVREALRSLSMRADVQVVRRIGVVLLFGDPLTRSREGTQLAGRDVRGVLIGDGPQLRLPRWAERAGVVQSYCAGTDPMCRPRATADDIGAHGDYTPDDLDFFLDRDAGTTLAGALGYLPTHRVVRSAYAAPARGRVKVTSDVALGRWRAPVVVAAKLPRGLELRRGLVSGRLPVGRYVARLRVRSARVAPAVTRRVKLVIIVRAPAGAAGSALISRGVDGQPADGASSDVHVSRDGRTVVFASTATNLVAADVARALDDDGAVAYAWDAVAGRVELVGVGPGGAPMVSTPLDVSDDGRFVLLRDAKRDLFLRDRQQGTTTPVPEPAEHPVWGRVEGLGTGSLSGDGSFVDRGFSQPGFWRWSRVDGSVRTFPLDATFAASSPDGQVAAVGGVMYRGVYLRNLATEVSGPVVPGSNAYRTLWADLSDGGRTMATQVDEIDWSLSNRVLDLQRSVLLDDDLPFVPGVSANGEWYTGDARAWQLQVRRTDGSAAYDAFVRSPRDADDRRAAPGAASLSGDGGVLAYTSAAVDLLPGVRPSDAQVYLWQVGR